LRFEGNTVSSTLASVAKFDEVKREPDDALTAYSYFPPVESALGELIDELFVKNWSCIVVGLVSKALFLRSAFVEPPQAHSVGGG
jgi:hypothetical protein